MISREVKPIFGDKVRNWMVLTGGKCRLRDEVEVFIEKLDRKSAGMISPIRDWDGVIGFGLVKGKAEKELAEGIVGQTFVVRTGW